MNANYCSNYDAQFTAIRSAVLAIDGAISPMESIASSAVKTARDVEAKLIVVLTETGNTARLIAKYRPSVPIIALTPSPITAMQTQGYLKNTFAKVVASGLDSDASLEYAIEHAKSLGWVSAGDTIVYVHGSRNNLPGSTNHLRIISI